MRILGLILIISLSACGGVDTEHLTTRQSPSIASGIDQPWPAVDVVPAPELLTSTRPLPHDVAAFKRVSDVRISPDGARVAYVVRSPTFDSDAEPANDDDLSGGWKVRRQLYVMDRDGGEFHQLTSGEAAVSSPRWSPDSQQIAFLRKKGSARALHVLSLAGGEARVVDMGSYVPRSFEWSPNGGMFAFTAERPRTDEEKRARFRSGGAKVYNEHYPQVHLFVVPQQGGSPLHVNRGTDSIADFRWSPDGRWFAIATAESSDPYLMHLLTKVSVISAADGEVIKRIEPEPSTIRSLAWSPNGVYLAYTKAGETLSLMNELHVHDVGKGMSWNAAAMLDPSLHGFVWSGDSRSIVALAYERTKSKLYRLERGGSDATPLEAGQRILGRGLHSDRAGRFLVTTSSTPTEPPDPTTVDLSSGEVRVIAKVNPYVEEWSLGATEVVRWKNAEGVDIEGLLHVTPHAKADAPPPLLVMPHGGPDSVSVESFHVAAHYFAARGFSVFRPNYRGGTGYGRDFYAANRGRLGEIEFADIEPGVDHLIETGRADTDRLLYGGWSWGGYISTWTLTKTNRYRAIVVGAGVVDVVVQYVTSDINHGVAGDWEFRGRPWSHPDHFARSNPALSLMKATTPTLIIHGEEDSRVSFVSGQTLHRALSDVGCKVRFLAYPRESHGFQEPAHVVHMFTEWAAWYEAHLARSAVELPR